MKIIISVLAVLIIAGGTAGGYFFAKAKYAKDSDTLRARITELENASATSSGSTSSSALDTKTANLNSAKAIVAKYLDAKKTRDIANAKLYMTANLYASTTQEEFAGTSSPSLNRYEITGAEYLENADLYQVTAKLTYTLQGADAGYYINNYMVENDDSEFLINEVKEGAWTEF